MRFYFDGSGERSQKNDLDEDEDEELQARSPGKSSRTHGSSHQPEDRTRRRKSKKARGIPGKVSLTALLAQRPAEGAATQEGSPGGLADLRAAPAEALQPLRDPPAARGVRLELGDHGVEIPRRELGDQRAGHVHGVGPQRQLVVEDQIAIEQGRTLRGRTPALAVDHYSLVLDPDTKLLPVRASQ